MPQISDQEAYTRMFEKWNIFESKRKLEPFFKEMRCPVCQSQNISVEPLNYGFCIATEDYRIQCYSCARETIGELPKGWDE